MTTRLDLRTSLRFRLEDTGTPPLWDDTALDDFLTEAMRRYGTRFPLAQSTTVVIGAGETSIVVTPDLGADQVVRVFDGEGRLVQRQHTVETDEPSSSLGSLGGIQAWRWWGNALVLAQGATAGTWTIDYLRGRSLPADDVTPVEVTVGDEEIIVLFAAATALRRREIEDGKRGLGRTGRRPIADMAATFHDHAEHLLRMRRRRVRGDWLSST